MYVIMDLEWVQSHSRIPNLTQIAALRVDDCWNPQDLFSSLIRPKGQAYRKWSHIGYTGAEQEEYLAAPSAEDALRALVEWLRDDDVLLWWAEEPANVFKLAVADMWLKKPVHPVRLLCQQAKSIAGIQGNAYKIAEKRGLNVPLPEHISVNDVETIRIVMQAIMPGPIDVSSWKKEDQRAILDYSIKYLYDRDVKLLHKAEGGCELPGARMKGYSKIKGCIKEKLKPCPVCLSREYRRASMEVTADVIARSQYNFIYRADSEVFHKKSCVHARRIPYIELIGAIRYDSCLEAGKHPCRLCNPKPEDTKFPINPIKKKKKKRKKAACRTLWIPMAQPVPGMARAFSEIEKQAYLKHIQKTGEKEAQAGENNNTDFLLYASSAYIFWAAKGYSTFHLRNCPKLPEKTELLGFARYDHATGKGFSPCRFCKPSRKYDLRIKVPGSRRIRCDETTGMLDELCKAYGYEHKLCESVYYISTPVGKWRLHVETCPVELWHINLVNCRGKTDEYHRQHRQLLSLKDTFRYIRDHDKVLLKKTRQEETEEPYPADKDECHVV